MFPGGQPRNMQQHGGQLPMVQYPGMYYNAVNPIAAPAWQSQSNTQADDGRDLLAQSYERMRNEMRSLQGGAKPDAPPPPSMDSSRNNAAIKMLLNNENVSLSSLLEAAMDPSTGSNKGTEDPIMKKTVLDKCEGKIAQLYRHRISGMGTFFPTVPPKGTKTNSSCFLTFHHPRIEFNMKRIDAVWHCSEVNVEAGQRKPTAKAVVEGNSVKPKKAKSPALEAAEEYANKPNPLESTNLVGYKESEREKPNLPLGQIPVIGPPPAVGSHPVVIPHQNIPTVDLTRPPPTTTSHPEPPSDPYATTAFELWAEIERERRHKEKLQEWETLNEKHKERDREKEERKRKKKRHRHNRSRSRSRSRSRNRRRSRSYSRSRSRHRERRYRSRSRRRTRSISLSPSPPRKRSISPRFSIQLSRSPPRRSPPRRMPSPRPLVSSLIPPSVYSNEPVSRFQPGPPGGEWPTSSAWPSSTSYGPPSDYYDPYGGRQIYPEGGDNYYGNNGNPPYNMPPNCYGVRAPFPPRGYHQMNGPPRGPHRWMEPSYGYRPPMNVVGPPPSSTAERSKTVTKHKINKPVPPPPLSQNLNLVGVSTTAAVKEQRNDSAGKKLKPESNLKVTRETTSKVHPPQKPCEVIVLDDDDVTIEKAVPKPISTSVDPDPPGVSPDRDLPQTTKIPFDKESEFTKPLRAKFKELLKPLEKVLDTIRIRQRESHEYKTLIKGLEIGSCEFDGVYTLVEGILCRVVIVATESAKTCFKIVLSPMHATSILMEIHKMYHDYTAYKIQETIEDLFYDVRLFPSWKIVNVIKICKVCKSEEETRRKKKIEMHQKSYEKVESSNADKESRSKSKSHRRRSVSKGRDDGKKSRRESKDDREQLEKTESHSSRKREDFKNATLKSGDVSFNVTTESSKKECSKQTSEGVKKVTDSAGDNDELRTVELASSDVLGNEASAGKKDALSNPSSEKPDKGSKMEAAPGKNHTNDVSSPLNHGIESLKPDGQLVDQGASKKPLVPYSIGKNNKPEDFKVRVRKAQLCEDDLKTLIASLEGPAKNDVDTNYLLKAGMLCKRVPTEQKNDGKSEVKIAVTPQSLLKMIQIVHTMAATHAPLEKTIAVFNKHFTPITGVQEAVSIVLNNCEVCKSL